MKKRLFQVLDEMNKTDIDTATKFVAVCNQMVEAKKSKNGDLVTMGTPSGTIRDLALTEHIVPMLILVNIKEYNRLKDIETPESKESIKARKWDKLEAEIAKCYPECMDEADEDLDEYFENADLTTIGELAASAFGFL